MKKPEETPQKKHPYLGLLGASGSAQRRPQTPERKQGPDQNPKPDPDPDQEQDQASRGGPGDERPPRQGPVHDPDQDPEQEPVPGDDPQEDTEEDEDEEDPQDPEDDEEDPEPDPEEDDQGFVQGPDPSQSQDQGYQTGPQHVEEAPGPRQPLYGNWHGIFPGRPRMGYGDLGATPKRRPTPHLWYPPPTSAPGSETPHERRVGSILEEIEDALQRLREELHRHWQEERGRGPDPLKDYIPPRRPRRTLL